jgi:cysteine desulfurase
MGENAMKYFDFAATTPLDRDAANVYIKLATEVFGNTSSLHDVGGQATQVLENCRETAAKFLGVDKKGLYFTSGGSESNFLALQALLSSPKKKGRHIITGMAEHTSIHSTLKKLEEEGYEVTTLPFNPNGVLDIEKLKETIRDDTVLITIQHTNSEIGTIQPIAEISDICQKHNLYFHSDFVQGIGKVDITSLSGRVSSFSFSSHKFYGPKGVGGVYIDPKINWTAYYPGTSHEGGLRPGTVNLPGIAAMTVALEKAVGKTEETNSRLAKLREAFIHSLQPIEDFVTIHGARGAHQNPGIIGISIDGIEGQWLMLECNRLGYAVSTGSACSSGKQSPSKTMVALGISGKKAKEFARISLGQNTTLEDVEKLGQNIVYIVNQFYRK